MFSPLKTLSNFWGREREREREEDFEMGIGLL
jgi:hypothetical protein